MSMKLRSGQREFRRGVDRYRLCALLARRQYGKTTLMANVSIRKMLRTPGHTVIFGSVKLDLGREITRKEAEVIQRAIQEFTRRDGLGVYDAVKDRDVTRFKPDDFAELYESQRLEFRLYHSKTIYSRTKVVALTPSAVGETGDLILDEVGRVQQFREVWEAVKPIIASNPDFRCILTTTPPPDDTHYSFELLAPPVGDDEFEPNPKGNWYRSELGMRVLRVDAWDAWADGVPLYDDDTGEPIPPEESRRLDPDKDGWDRNYGVKFVTGGTAAIGLTVLHSAQERGVGQCTHIAVDTESDVDNAVAFLLTALGPGPVGLGWDLATTTNKTSNPSALTTTEQRGIEFIAWLILTWKTADPDVALDRVRRILRAVESRRVGGRARKLCIDATNERYFAADVKKKLLRDLPVEMVVGSERVEKPGHEPMNMKEWLGSQLVGDIEDNHWTLPPERYIHEDFRLVRREKGLFVCTPDVDGKHGDTFDSTKLSRHALVSGNSGRFIPPASNGRRARALRLRKTRIVAG